jgi:hypothetical protein
VQHTEARKIAVLRRAAGELFWLSIGRPWIEGSDLMAGHLGTPRFNEMLLGALICFNCD